jgi:hypothetical protein
MWKLSPPPARSSRVAVFSLARSFDEFSVYHEAPEFVEEQGLLRSRCLQ